MAERYDAIVIGTGQGGKPLALALAGAGWKTAVIERKWVGGSCVNYGCTPTKTMIASARVAYLSRRAAVYGVDAGPVRVDMARVRQRKRTLVESFRSRSQTRLEQSPNSELIFGEASFLGRDTVAVKLARGGARELRAPNIFINVGLRPARPAIPGLDQVKALDSTSIMELDEVPQHLIVLGGGYVGLEFGQMFRRFGSQVSIVEAGPQLLSLEDGDVADEMAKILREDGIEILLATKVESAAQEGSSIRLTLSSVHGQRELTGSHLLVAVGRVPDTAALELAAAGVATDERGFVRVSDRLETSIPDIYAIGDVKGGPAFTHISYDDYRILETNLLKGGNATVRGRLVPYCVFTDPELGRVGMTEREARAGGRKVGVAKLPMTSVARALETDDARGFMKAVVDAETREILGYAVLGVSGGELMSAVEIAMMGKLPYTALRDAIFAHPVLAESLNNLFMALEG